MFQRTCYLSINPLKEESVDTEKVQYTLPDGNTVEVSAGVAQGGPGPSETGPPCCLGISGDSLYYNPLSYTFPLLLVCFLLGFFFFLFFPLSFCLTSLCACIFFHNLLQPIPVTGSWSATTCIVTKQPCTQKSHQYCNPEWFSWGMKESACLSLMQTDVADW